MKTDELTTARIREVLDYNPHTGVFVWKVRLMMKAPAGSVAGSDNGKGYLCTEIDGHAVKLHRLAFVYMTGELPNGEVDHINGIKHDNRWANLRDVDRATNVQNVRHARRDNKSSGLLGAYWDQKCNRWRSAIFVDGRSRSLGLFETPEEAHEAYLKAKRDIHKGCTI